MDVLISTHLRHQHYKRSDRIKDEVQWQFSNSQTVL